MEIQDVLQLVVVVLLLGQTPEASHYRGGFISIGVTGPEGSPLLTITTSQAENDDCESEDYYHTIRSVTTGDILFDYAFLIPSPCTGNDPVADVSFFMGSETIALDPSNGVIEVSYDSCCWISTFNGENYKVFSRIDISAVRADTELYNSNPITTVPVYLVLAQGCSSYQIPVSDPDGDTVKCRVGMGVDECGPVCQFNDAQPNLIQENCMLDFAQSGVTSGGPFLINLVLEDFIPGSDTPLSFTFANIFMTFSTMSSLIEGHSPSPNAVTIDPMADNIFTLQYDETVVGFAGAVYFIDAVSEVMLHTITVKSAPGSFQVSFPGMSLEMRPFIDFTSEQYQGRTVCILADRGIGGAPGCMDGVTAPITEPNFWCFSVPRNECRYGAWVNCTTSPMSPEYCDVLYDPTWGPCGPYTTCENTADSYQCPCLDGYEPDPSLTAGCRDRDECIDGAYVNCTGPPSPLTCDVVFDTVWGPCGRNTSCTNLPGTYRCDCLTGYTPDPRTPLACLALCRHPDTSPHTSLVFQDTLLVNSLNEGDVATFVCEAGYEVSPGVGSWSQQCLDTGSWNVSTPTYCGDVDECSQYPDLCGAGFCLNVPASYVCFCLPGQIRNSPTGLCETIVTSTPRPCGLSCSNGGVCVLQDGESTCVCPAFYSGRLCKTFTDQLRLPLVLAGFALSLALLQVLILCVCYTTRQQLVKVPLPQPPPPLYHDKFITRRPMFGLYGAPVGRLRR